MSNAILSVFLGKRTIDCVCVHVCAGVEIVAVLTQTLVDESDPAFQHPSKPIGVQYTKEEADRISKSKARVDLGTVMILLLMQDRLLSCITVKCALSFNC